MKLLTTVRSRTVAAGMMTLAVALTATAATAADQCFLDQFGDIVVMKRQRDPRPSDCQPIHGYQHGTGCAVTGTACGTSDGATVKYRFHYICTAEYSGPTALDLDRGDTTGLGSACDANINGNPWGCSVYSFRKVDCPKPADYR
jgi:hypothetical protein